MLTFVEQDPGDIEPGHELLSRLQKRLVLLLGGSLPPIERAEAGRTLGSLGDPREEVMTLPAMPFSYVPAGLFLMGDEGTKVDVSYDYWISQHPVTQAQYQAFVDAGGYEDKQWWTEAGWKQLTDKEKRTEPYRFPNPVYQLPNHPVVGVMWYEAYAFTKWLRVFAVDQGWVPSGTRILLPNEPEWEKGARGGLKVASEVRISGLNGLEFQDVQPLNENPEPSRRYPWGEEITSNHCSYNETEIGTTSTPGCFPSGVSPYEVHDMSGNVLEWNRSKWESTYLEGFESEREDAEGEDPRVLRGGSFGNSNNFVRCAYRRRSNPSAHFHHVGISISCSPSARIAVSEKRTHR